MKEWLPGVRGALLVGRASGVSISTAMAVQDMEWDPLLHGAAAIMTAMLSSPADLVALSITRLSSWSHIQLVPPSYPQGFQFPVLIRKHFPSIVMG